MRKAIHVSETILRDLVAQHLNYDQIAEKMGLNRSLIRKRCYQWGIKISAVRPPTSPETRALQSRIKKAWCAANPDKHPWRRPDKKRSKPCEYLKGALVEANIPFVYEIEPLFDLGYYYSLDIAFPDKMLGIEVNGNQHYNRDGTLKPYYQKRHDLFVEHGWEIMEIHYSAAFNPLIMNAIAQKISDTSRKTEFDYVGWKPRNKKQKIKVSDIDPKWRHRPRPTTHKVGHPSKERLGKMVWEQPTEALAKQLGVSGTAISKWCKRLNVTKPPRGYWNKIKAGIAREEALRPNS